MMFFYLVMAMLGALSGEMHGGEQESKVCLDEPEHYPVDYKNILKLKMGMLQQGPTEEGITPCSIPSSSAISFGGTALVCHNEESAQQLKIYRRGMPTSVMSLSEKPVCLAVSDRGTGKGQAGHKEPLIAYVTATSPQSVRIQQVAEILPSSQHTSITSDNTSKPIPMVSEDTVSALAFNSDGTRLAVGTQKGLLFLLNMDTDVCSKMGCKPINRPVTAVSFNKENIVLWAHEARSAGGAITVQWVNTRNLQSTGSFDIHQNKARKIILLSPEDSGSFVACSELMRCGHDDIVHKVQLYKLDGNPMTYSDKELWRGEWLAPTSIEKIGGLVACSKDAHEKFFKLSSELQQTIVACSGNLDEQNLLADLQRWQGLCDKFNQERQLKVLELLLIHAPKGRTFGEILERLDQQVLLLTEEDWQNAHWITINYHLNTLARSFWCYPEYAKKLWTLCRTSNHQHFYGRIMCSEKFSEAHLKYLTELREESTIETIAGVIFPEEGGQDLVCAILDCYPENNDRNGVLAICAFLREKGIEVKTTITDLVKACFEMDMLQTLRVQDEQSFSFEEEQAELLARINRMLSGDGDRKKQEDRLAEYCAGLLPNQTIEGLNSSDLTSCLQQIEAIPPCNTFLLRALLCSTYGKGNFRDKVTEICTRLPAIHDKLNYIFSHSGDTSEVIPKLFWDYPKACLSLCRKQKAGPLSVSRESFLSKAMPRDMSDEQLTRLIENEAELNFAWGFWGQGYGKEQDYILWKILACGPSKNRNKLVTVCGQLIKNNVSKPLIEQFVQTYAPKDNFEQGAIIAACRDIYQSVENIAKVLQQQKPLLQKHTDAFIKDLLKGCSSAQQASVAPSLPPVVLPGPNVTSNQQPPMPASSVDNKPPVSSGSAGSGNYKSSKQWLGSNLPQLWAWRKTIAITTTLLSLSLVAWWKYRGQVPACLLKGCT